MQNHYQDTEDSSSKSSLILETLDVTGEILENTMGKYLLTPVHCFALQLFLSLLSAKQSLLLDHSALYLSLDNLSVRPAVTVGEK